ncbi:MAG: FtsW/RodA/SpoVE family cell cycle protein, partial [Phycisphaerae bacterium]|nr:FtsW/RodA/SpoVE family cell cycle protein [Phycisphaerae bacterium]
AAGAFYFFIMRSPHRWSRILAVLDPSSQANRCAYQARQSLLAIRLGGWFGSGVGRGIQKLGYLPEDSTDFIFAAYCEEWGFIGAALLMGLFLFWMWHARRAAVRAGDRFGQLLAGSLGLLIAMQVVLHMAVAMVVAPPTGMSLPFVSAGGTALVIMAATTAVIISVTAHRQAAPSRLRS